MSNHAKPAQKSAGSNGRQTRIVLAALIAAAVLSVVFAWNQTAKAGVSATMQDGVQTIDISALPQFSPQEIVLRAGVPSRLRIGPGQGCTAAFVVPELGIQRDLTNGGAVIDLPALDKGEYVFTCQMGHKGGALVVR